MARRLSDYRTQPDERKRREQLIARRRFLRVRLKWDIEQQRAIESRIDRLRERVAKLDAEIGPEAGEIERPRLIAVRTHDDEPDGAA